MSKIRNVLLGFAAAGCLAALGGVSLAQAPQGALPGPPPRTAPDQKKAHHPAMRAQMLRERLKLSSGQEAAFQSWLAATARPERGDRPDRSARPGPKDRRATLSLPTPQRLDNELAALSARQADLKTRADATKRFYALLSAEQKAQFDQMPPRAVLGMGGPGGARMAMGSRGGDRFEGRGKGRDRDRGDRRGPDGGYKPQ